MGTPPVLDRGSVVLVRFPFSDLSASKLRPAVVLAHVGQGDYVLLQVTSRRYGDPRAVELEEADFVRGGLHRTSFVRPGKLFTANESLIVRPIGQLSSDTVHRLVAQWSSFSAHRSSAQQTRRSTRQ